MANILIIDDDAHVREALQAVLIDEGHEVRLAAGANEATTYLAHSAAKTDLILLDIWLGEDNGLNLLGEIRSGGFTQPVIVMSGGGPGRTLEQATAIADVQGANQVLIKPFTNEEISNAIRDVLAAK
ncbi:MAG: response regulator [Aquisalinus sp.]|nr:response regulator [Aquisalinus sp.]